MKKIGITGRIGSGKSTICRVFEHLGIPIYYSDIQAKASYKTNFIKSQMRLIYGDKIFSSSQEIDLKKLSEIVFQCPEEMQKVNKIVHPYIEQDFLLWCKQQKAPYVLFESALIYSTELKLSFDDIIFVNTPLEELIQRVQIRNNLTIEEVKQRLVHQQISEEKIQSSKYIINNADNVLVLPQILKIDSLLRMKA